jgi:hypothetical protein
MGADSPGSGLIAEIGMETAHLPHWRFMGENPDLSVQDKHFRTSSFRIGG